MERRTELRTKLLLAALRHVTFDGWTDVAFHRAISDLGWSIEEYDRLFPSGPPEAGILLFQLADLSMSSALTQKQSADFRTRDRVSLALRIWLTFLNPYKDAVRRLVPFMSLSGNNLLGLECLYHTVDTIWYSAGDKSTDFNFYTKRALLASVLSSSILFWLNDNSFESEDTWGFIDRRIENIMSLQKLRTKVDGLCSRLPDLSSLLRVIRPINR